MQFKSIFLALLAGASISNAVIVDLFADPNCETPAGSRNVFDNSCAPLGGFQSFIITFSGGSDQVLTSYGPNDCVTPTTACLSAAIVTGDCISAVNSAGGSNAMGSGPGCGII